MSQNRWNFSLTILNGTGPPKSPGLPPIDSRLQQRIEIQRTVNISYNLLLALLSLLGNSSLLAIFIQRRNMRTAANCFIFNMAISDLAYVVVVIPVTLQNDFTRSIEWRLSGVLGSITCKLIPFIRDVSFTVSILSMVAIALDRFYAVVYPLNRKPRALKPKVAIPVIWFVSMASFAIYFYTHRLVVLPLYKTVFCFTIWIPVFDPVKSPRRQYLFVVIAYFLIPLILMTVVYSIIIHKLRRQNIPGERTSEIKKLRRKQNRSITKVGVFLVLCFFFSWAPYHCLMLLGIFVWIEKPPSPDLSEVIQILMFIASNLSIACIASNACVCYACSSRFRSCLRQMLSKWCCPSQRRQGIQMSTSNMFNNNRGQLTATLSLSHTTHKDTERSIGISNNAISVGQTIENLELGFLDTKL